MNTNDLIDSVKTRLNRFCSKCGATAQELEKDLVCVV